LECEYCARRGAEKTAPQIRDGSALRFNQPTFENSDDWNRVTAIHPQNERKQQDMSVRRAEERRGRARILRVHGPICPTSGVWATTDAAQGEKRLFNWQNQVILTSGGRPLGECRFLTIPLKRVKINE
jgi:hypothetical protein